MAFDPLLLIYLVPLLALWGGWISLGARRSKRDLAVLEEMLVASAAKTRAMYPAT